MSIYGFSSPDGRNLAIVGIIFFAVATISMVLRLTGKTMRKQRLQLDDAFVIFAWVCSLPLTRVISATNEIETNHRQFLLIPFLTVVLLGMVHDHLFP
jgi:hypothetical protein